MSEKTAWASVLRSVVQRHPHLATIRIISHRDGNCETLPSIIQLTAATAVELARQPGERLSSLFPRADRMAIWVAAGAALDGMRREFEREAASAAEFVPGQRLLIDRCRVEEYDSQTAEHFVLRSKAGLHYVPKSERLRLQPTTSRRALSNRGLIGPSAPSDPLHRILGIDTQGNRSLFHPSVLLVSPVGTAVEYLKTCVVAAAGHEHEPITLADLIPCKAVRMDGRQEPISPGQIDAEAVLLLAPDLNTACTYAEQETAALPLIVLAGSTSFRVRADVLDQALEAGWSSLACLDPSDEECLHLLSSRRYGIWRWAPADVKALDAAEPEPAAPRLGHSTFDRFRCALSSYADRTIGDRHCRDQIIQEAAMTLLELEDCTQTSEADVQEIKRLLFTALLNVGRQVRPICGDIVLSLQRLHDRICQLVNFNALLLSETATATVNEFLAYLDGITERPDAYEPGKVAVLASLLGRGTGTPTAVVLPTAEEAAGTGLWWQRRLGVAAEQVRFCCPATLPPSGECRHLIVCGWLGTQRMHRLIQGSVAPEITLLLYPFEREWFYSVQARWESRQRGQLSALDEARLLGLTPDMLPTGPTSTERVTATDSGEGLSPAFDITQFELRAADARRASLAREAAGLTSEEECEAYFVEFADGYYAFLTEHHELPTVTHLLGRKDAAKEQVAMKTALELAIGDFVVFREGSQSDVIRELADAGLRAVGKAHLRQLAGTWKQALREYAGLNPVPISRRCITGAVNRLRSTGIQRTDMTLRTWLLSEYPIGPADDDDLARIAEITAHTVLNARLEAVRQAIREVRGAHLSASSYLAKVLAARLPSVLADATAGTSHRFSIDNLSSVIVVRIETLSRESDMVGSGRVNTLHREAT